MGRLNRTPFLGAVGAAAAAVTLLSPLAAGAAERTGDYDASPPWSGRPTSYVEQDLAVGGQDGFPNYRIPALTVTNSGDILASYDGRPTGADAPAPNTILQRRSVDGGLTWQEATVVRAGATTPREGYSDPSYIVDRETGTIFNFHVFSMDQGFGGSRPGVDPADRNVIQANVAVSEDEGRTWQHRTITADITADLGWRSRFASAGQGIQLKYGPHAGRLIQQYTIINAQGQFQAVSVYSDDHGQTWQAGQPVGVGMDENKTVELSDGRVMLNSRDSARSGYRKVAYSEDGGVTYGPVSIDRELPDPTNNASIVRAFPNAAQGSDRAKVLLFSNAASTTSRSNGTVRMSCDDGETWPAAKVFQPGAMSYSTLATLPDGDVGLLYEPGNDIRFAKFDLAWLEGLCAPLTIPELTVERGQSTTTTLIIENQLGPAIRVADLTVDAPEGWAVDVQTYPARLNPGAQVALDVAVTVPAETTGGTYRVPITLTDVRGRSSNGTLTVSVPKTEQEVDGRIQVTGGTLINPKATDYVVGDRLQFRYRVTNLTSAVTTVVPTGSLSALDPAQGAPNCRWLNLPANGAYNCTSPFHVVTTGDLTRGSFTPVTTWTSTSGEDVTVVEHRGDTINLP